MVILNLSEIKLSSLNKRPKLLSSYLPVSPSRVLRAPGSSLYHLVPKQFRPTWPRPEQSHLFPEACSPNGTDNRRQRQRQTERPPPEPSNILKRFCALYNDKIRHYKKKVSKSCSLLTVCSHFGNIRFQLKSRKHVGSEWLKLKAVFGLRYSCQYDSAV